MNTGRLTEGWICDKLRGTKEDSSRASTGFRVRTLPLLHWKVDERQISFEQIQSEFVQLVVHVLNFIHSYQPNMSMRFSTTHNLLPSDEEQKQSSPQIVSHQGFPRPKNVVRHLVRSVFAHQIPARSLNSWVVQDPDMQKSSMFGLFPSVHSNGM